MSDKFFIDSNVLIYSIDKRDLQKHSKAQNLVSDLIKNSKGFISTQVLQEFFNVSSKKLKATDSDIRKMIEFFSNNFPVRQISISTILKAIDIRIQTQFSFWDSLILSAAKESGCNILYSEDLNDGQIVEGVKIVNPFN